MRWINVILCTLGHCTILMKTTRLNEDIDRAVRGVCDIRPKCTKMQFSNRIFIDQKKNI